MLLPNKFDGQKPQKPGVAEAIPAINMHQHAPSSSASAPKLEEDHHHHLATTKPALLPLFPPVPASSVINCPPPNYSPEWSELLDKKSVFPPRPVDIASMDDYLNSLGYPSEFALTKSPHESRGANIRYGSFFDDVASFAKVGDSDLSADGDGVVALETGDLSTGVVADLP